MFLQILSPSKVEKWESERELTITIEMLLV